MLLICETHPVQYHAPVYQALQRLDVPFQVVYGSNFSVMGYRDAEFQADFAWDTDLLSGYQHRFINTVQQGGPTCYAESHSEGLLDTLNGLNVEAVLALGYRVAFDRGVLSAARRLKKPLLLRTEASDDAITRGFWKSLLRDFVLRRLYSSCEGFMYVGKLAQRHYKRLGVPDSKLFFSPYCVSTSAFNCGEANRTRLRREMRTQLGIDEQTRVAMFCGKLSQRKGVDLLLAAIRQLPDALREKTMLLYVGEGAMRSELERIAKELPAVAIHITGFKNQRELSPYYHASDVAVLPSVTSETWGLVVNESLHHGLPCLASNRVGSATDLIEAGVTGEIVQAGDINSLSQSLNKYLANPIGETQRNACRKLVAGYSVEQAAAGIALAYASCRVGTAG